MADFFSDICVGCIYDTVSNFGGFLAFLFFIFILMIVIWEVVRPKK